MIQWQKLLRSLGFTESEAKLYLISLESGPTSVQDLAKKTKVSRVTTYAAIEGLMKGGLMSTVEKGKKTLYIAETPDKLVSFVQSRLKHMEATLREVETSIQDLKLLQRGEKPVVKVFEGPESFTAIVSAIAQSKAKDLYEFENLDTILAHFTREQLQPFRDVKARMPDMKTYALIRAEREAIHQGPNDDFIRLDPKYVFGGDVEVFGNYVALSTFRGKEISVLIESEEIANTVRAMFKVMMDGQRGR